MAERNKDGTFKAGHPGFKKPGQQPFTVLKKKLRSNEKEIIASAIEQATSGKCPAVMVHILKKMYGSLPISDFKMSGSAPDCMKQIIEGVGSIPAETLSEAAKLVESKIKVDDLVQMKSDIEEIKKSLESNVL